MSLLQWKIETKEGTVLKDEISIFKGGPVHVVKEVPAGETFKRVSAQIRIPLTEDGRVFMNGYQSGTYVPERTGRDAIRGLMLMHQAIVDRNSYDRYGDYHFVEYPNKRGTTHGFSWCYFREGERFQLIASLDERPGYTMFTYEAPQERLTIERDCRNVTCANNGDGFHAFDLFFAEGTEQEVFDAWFEALQISPRTSARMAGITTAYSLAQNVSAESVCKAAGEASRVLEQGDLILIGDGWETYVGDWFPNAKTFPGGMKETVDKIHENGFKAGLWLAPFIAEKSSVLMKNNPERAYQRKEKKWKCGNLWSGFYALDFDNADVRTYLTETFRRVFDEWGFDLVKLDYLYAAAPFGSKQESRASRMIRALEWLREVCGDRLILASNVPLMPAFGIVDYCRVGPDVTLDWDDKPLMRLAHRERPSTRHAVGNAIYHRQLDGRAFLADADAFFLRKDNIRLSESQKVQLYEACAEYGSVLLSGDDVSKYDDSRISQYRSIRDAWAG